MNQEKLPIRCSSEEILLTDIKEDITRLIEYSFGAIQKLRKFVVKHPVGSKVTIENAWWHHSGPQTMEVEICGFSHESDFSTMVHYKVLDTERFWAASLDYFSQCSQASKE